LRADVPTTASLAAVREGLPTDPIAATDALVSKVFGPDEKTAVAATAEILRRAGIPLVSVTGPVVALPDADTIVNESAPVELLPMLTRDVRAGEFYTPDQVAAMLQYLDVSTTALTARGVVGLLAGWGKQPGDPRESVVAGAAVRALAAQRHQLLIPAEIPSAATEKAMQSKPASLTTAQRALLVDPTRVRGLGMLQVLLLIAHTTGQVASRVTVTATAPSAPGLRRQGASASPCQTLQAKGDSSQTKDILRKTALKDAMNGLSEDDAGKLKGHLRGARVFKGLIGTYLLLKGATISLTSNKPTTHFRHQPYDESRNVTFTATAMFSSSLARGRVACSGISGARIPPSGPLEGFTVRWALDQEIQMLRPMPGADARKLLRSGEKTDSAGKSTLKAMPRREVQPPEPGDDAPVHTGYTTVVAHLDKMDFSLKAGDLFGLASDSESAPFFASLKMALGFIKSAGLPNAVMQFPVTYHASDAFAINGQATLEIPGMGAGSWTAALYSCQGPAGPWKGTVSINGSASGALLGVARVAGYGGKASGKPEVAHPSFRLNPNDGDDQVVPLGGTDHWSLVIDLDPAAVAHALHPTTAIQRAALGSGAPTVVGTGSWSAAGTDLRTIARLFGDRLMSGSTFYVQFSPGDSRCKGGSSVLDDVFDPS
jgi:hypothetical protein